MESASFDYFFGKSVTDLRVMMSQFNDLIKQGQIHTLAPLAPLLLNLDGKPYSLENHFPFEPFFSTWMPQALVLKSGRQCSKTGKGENMVLLSNGLRKRLKDIKVGDLIISMGRDFRSTPKKIINTVDAGNKNCYRIRTRLGAVVEVAETHPFLKLSNNWTIASDLKAGDRIATFRKCGKFGTHKVPYERLILTPYMIGDGCCGTNKTYEFTSACPECLTEFSELTSRLQINPVKRYLKAGSLASSIRMSRTNELVRWFKEDGLAGKYSHEKSIPKWVFSLSKKDTSIFISRLWATDGMIKANRTGHLNISYCSTSKDLTYDLRSLLLKYGILSSIKQRETGYRKNGKFFKCRDAYILRLETRQSFKLFFKNFRVPGKPTLSIKNTYENNNRITLPKEVNKLINKLCEKTRFKHKNSLYSNDLRITLKYPPTYQKLNSYINYFSKFTDPTDPSLVILKNLHDGDVVWDEIEEIEHIGEHHCIDIEVEDTHNYTFDGLITHNSTSIAATGIILANSIPYFRLLYVTPLYEQIRRFSNNYVRPFIEQSPIRALWTSTTTENSVLQRSFKNQSMMHFSYAFLDADRIRGIKSDITCYDEIQSLDRAHIPIINETMSYSKYGMERYTGTPLTRDNTLEGLWLRSSMAEWAVPCMSCKKLNIPRMGYDLEKMIGPLHDNIGLGPGKVPATICANSKCRKPIDPRIGRWLHEKPGLKHKFAGYHVPQIIMPLHYANYDKWAKLLAKQNGAGNVTTGMFYNEVLGESYDLATKLLSMTDLEKAGCLHENKEDVAAALITKYTNRVLGVDWGGGGEDGVSFTTISVAGLTPTGQIHIIYGKRSLTPHDHLGEAREVLRLYNKFNCDIVCHDYTGAGTLRETFMVHAGFPRERLMPCQYVRTASRNIINFVPATIQHPRDYYRIDKPRSLQLTCYAIKLGKVLTFKYDFVDNDNPGLLTDFLSLIENKIERDQGGEIYTIIRNEQFSDDFAHATNLACCCLWHMTGSWPVFTEGNGAYPPAPPDIDPGNDAWREDRGGGMGGYLGY